eukprot:m.190207 g.190207  ORF g.190207 m.190207 type:complete len:759 (-) comp32396_c1_seq5:146-2422(-)
MCCFAKKFLWVTTVVGLTTSYIVSVSSGQQPTKALHVVRCDVVVVGGSVAGLAAAVTSAKQGVHTCLLEPTDMIGGQMTANGIPALDFDNEDANKLFNVTGASPDTFQENMAFDFAQLLHSLPPPNYRHTCWVSPYCFLPTVIFNHGIQNMLNSAGSNLTVYKNTVLLNATMVPSSITTNDPGGVRIQSVVAIQRTITPSASCGGYGTRLSQSLPDWYSVRDSTNFTKQLIRFQSDVWIDTSYNGELLVLSGAPYLQGIDERFDGDTSGVGNDTVGQSFTMTFQILMHKDKVKQQRDFPPMNPEWPPPNPFLASPAIHTPTHKLTWESLWTRRRSYHAPGNISNNDGDDGPTSTANAQNTETRSSNSVRMNPPAVNNVSVGDVMLNAWPDFYYDYIFESKAAAQCSISTDTWVGGYNVRAIEGAERYSYGAYVAYANAAPAQWLNRTTLNSTYMGTCHGLTKMPYIRDGRRSIGLDDFIIDIDFVKSNPSPPDCVALAGHGFDIWGHHMLPFGNAYPAYMQAGGSTGDICVPLRALTNKNVSNLIVGGYTMAQSFMINSALRMHPQEFTIGVGAGATGAHMVLARLNSTAATLAPTQVAAIQDRIRQHAPLTWTRPPSPPPHSWPKAIGYVCATPFVRCIQVPGGGAFTINNTHENCSTISSPCSPTGLGVGEWLALVGSMSFDSQSMIASFKSSTKIKKSTVNSVYLPPQDVIDLQQGQQVQLIANISDAFKVDNYTYVLLRCKQPRCLSTSMKPPM